MNFKTEEVNTEEWANNLAQGFQQKLSLLAPTEANAREQHRIKMREVVERRKQNMRNGLVYDQTIHEWVVKTEFDQSHTLGWEEWLRKQWAIKNEATVPKMSDLLNMGELI